MTAKFGLLIDAKTKGENNIKRLGTSMQGVQGKAKNLATAVRGVGTAFKALFAAAAVAGFARFVQGAIDTADAFGKLEVRTGIAAEKLLAYVNAGKLAGVSQKQLETGLKTLARTQAEAADGVKTYSDAYNKLGISVKAADGSLKPSDQLLGEIADKFKDLPDGPEKAAIAMDLFGKSGADMITLLNGGSEALEEFNYQLSDKFAQNAEYYNDQITKMGFAFDGFRMQLMDALMPALIQITEAFTDLFNTEADWSSLFLVIEAGIRTIAGVTYATIAALKFFGRTLVDLVKIADRVARLDFKGAGEIISQGLADTAEQFGKDTANIVDIFTKSSEAPEGYGRRTTGFRLPSTVDASGRARNNKEDQKALRLERERVQTGRQIVDYTLQRVAAFSKLLQGLADEKALLEGKLAGNEKEVALAIKIRKETEGMPPLIAKAVEERIRGNEELQDAVNKQEEQNKKLAEEAQKLNDFYKSIGDTITSSVGGALEGLIFQSKSLGESLKSLAQSLAKMFLQFGVQTAFGALGESGGFLGKLFGNAKGNVFAENKIVPFAYGGVVNKPTLFPMANGMGLMGEAGPEAIMPLRRGPGGRLGVEANGGLGNVVVNVDASGTRAQGDDQNAKALGSAIGAAVQAELIKQKRPGGLLS
jgi:hypothetical protein